MLFDDEELKKLIAAQPDLRLIVKDNEGWYGPDFPSDTGEVYVTVGGVVNDVERLTGLFALFSRLLDQLCHIGSAYEPALRVRP